MQQFQQVEHAHTLPVSCEVLIVGSGYGASVAAARLAAAGRRVCVLERGRAFRPGEFSRSPTADVRVTTPLGDVGRQDALAHYTVGDGVLIGCGVGLGGGSLVNSGILMRPDPRVLASARWPEALRRAAEDGELEAEFVRAIQTLGGQRAPATVGVGHRQAALRRAGAALEQPVRDALMTVHFEAGTNGHGVAMSACSHCGECNAGCNAGAKGDLTTSYHAIARRHGARFFTEVEVDSVQRHGEGWRVDVRHVGSGRERFGDETLWITAEIVVLGAGSLGSTEILLRSAERGLPLSHRLGRGFSTNGTALGFSWGADALGTMRGDGDAAGRQVGPGITGFIDARATSELQDGVVIEDGLHPRWAREVMRVALGTAASRRPIGMLRGVARRGTALDRSMNWLFIGHDGADGQLRRVGGRLIPSHRGPHDRAARLGAATERMSAALGAVPVEPSTQVTMHPLGGCGMAESGETGVTDDRGRVFAGSRGDAVHPGLYVMDGSLIPSSLGSNPILTITAIAERAVRLLIADAGWQPRAPAMNAVGATIPPSPTAGRPFGPRAPDRLQFSERMAGTLRLREGGSSACTMLLTAMVPDVEAWVADAGHPLQLAGTVRLPALCHQPLRVETGRLALFVPDPDAVRARQMVYTMTLRALDGRSWQLRGVKQIEGWHVLQGWGQTTRLAVTVADDAGQTVALGELRLGVRDFVRQLRTWTLRAAPGRWQRLRSSARFVGVFTDGLRAAYGDAEPEPPPRRAVERRALRLPEPTSMAVQAGDRTALALTRYRGGGRGPVLLLHGYAATERLFTNDTIDTCLTEALVEAGHDVWIGSWRGAGDLDAARRPFDLDDVAKHDMPALVARVRGETGARQLDIVAHCLGSRTALMALTAGTVPASAVRRYLGLQVGLHWQNTPMSWLRAQSRLPDALARLGVDSLRSNYGPSDGLHYKALDVALRALPVERHDRCTDATCRRNSAIWGQLFHHPNLRRDTHATIDELLGRANVHGIADVARHMRHGRALARGDEDRYLSQLQRLTFPILMLYSDRNGAVAPGTSKRTIDALQRLHGEGLHRWETVPGYGHLDTLVGRDAWVDVFPRIVDFLAMDAARSPGP